VSRPLHIALVCPHGWPPGDDIAHQVAAEGAALARRGHGVSVLAPARRRDGLADGRARLRAAEAGDPSGLLAAPGEVRHVAIGRALPAGAGRRLGGPFDLAAALETGLRAAPFDVVHLHEPLAPSPALAALRHARGVTATTFHRVEPLAGVAFLRPLVDRALARADLRIVTAELGRRALEAVLPGDYRVVRPGVDAEVFADAPRQPDAPPGLVLVARARDRVGLRFALGALRALDDLAAVGPITVIGPPDAPWRTRAAVPKALREAVTVVPDAGPAARAAALAGAAIAVLAAPEEASGPVLLEAMASGCAIVAPRCHAIEEVARHGAEAIVLPPFSRELWSAAIAELSSSPVRREELSLGAAARARGRGWDEVAAELEAAYAAAMASGPRRLGGAEVRVAADLRVRTGAGADAARVVAAARARGLGVVAVAAPGGIGPALAVARAAPPDLAVVVGQEIATDDGLLVGLFLTRDVPDGLSPEDAAAAVHEQGGIVMAPHPDPGPAPSAATLRRLGPALDCHEVLSGASGGPGAEESAELARRLGLLGCAGSGATRAEHVGAAVTELRPFHGPADMLDALAVARLVRPARVRRRRAKGRVRRLPES